MVNMHVELELDIYGEFRIGYVEGEFRIGYVYFVVYMVNMYVELEILGEYVYFLVNMLELIFFG